MDLRQAKLSSRSLIPLALAIPITGGLTAAERAARPDKREEPHRKSTVAAKVGA